jgi:DNA-binding NarL/FixJ family response regulator
MTITVFLADDHAVVRDGLRALLDAQEDIEVVGDAADGLEAARQVEELQPDVVLMDVTMPELSGIDATRRIHRTCPAVRVIMLSMHDTTEHVFRALKAGARGYVLKESAGAEVIEAVRTVHKGHRYLTKKITDQLINDYIEQRGTVGFPDPLTTLGPRELEVLQLVVAGYSSTQIAGQLALSAKTIDTYRARIMRKLGIKNVADLVKFAVLHGLVSLE